jgi:hypothetical protein
MGGNIMKLIPILIGGLLIMSAALVYAGEKGGTEDINIGVGELQESSVETGITTEQDPATRPGAVRVSPGTAKPERKGNAETTWKIEKGEK